MTERTSHGSLLLGVLIAVGLVAGACGGSPEGGADSNDASSPGESASADDVRQLPNGAKIKDGIHLRPGIQIVKFPMDVAEGVAFDRGTGVLELTGPAARTARRQGAESGDVVAAVNGPEKPILARIDEIDDTGGAIYVETAPFVFEQVFWGDWDFAIPVDVRRALREEIERNDDLEATDPPFRTTPQRLGVPSVSFKIGAENSNCENWTPWSYESDDADEQHEDSDLDTKAGPEMSVCLKSKLSFPRPTNTVRFRGKLPHLENPDGHSCSDPQFDPWWSPKDYCVDHLKLRTALNVRPSHKLLLRASAGARAEYEKELFSRGLGQYPVGTTGLAISPEFRVFVGAIAESRGEAEVWGSAAATFHLPVGFEYNNGGPTRAIPNPDDPAEIRNTAVDAGTGYRAYVRGQSYIGAGLDLQLEIAGLPDVFEVTGPGIEARGSTTATYQPVADTRPDWGCAKVDVGAEVGYSMEVGAEISTPFQWTLFTVLEISDTIWSETFLRWTGDGDYCPGGPEHGDGGGYDPDDYEPDPSVGEHDAEPAFKIEAIWSSDADIDLHATPPDAGPIGPGESSGEWIHPFDVCGDGCEEGGDHAEALVYHPASAAPAGVYSIRVENNRGPATDVTVNVRRGDHLVASRELRLGSGRSHSFTGNYDPNP